MLQQAARAPATGRDADESLSGLPFAHRCRSELQHVQARANQLQPHLRRICEWCGISSGLS